MCHIVKKPLTDVWNEEIIKTSRNITTDFERNKTLSIIEKFRIRQRQPSEGGKVAIIIGNSIYKNGMSHLEGAKRDLDEVSAIMEKVQYKVHKVADFPAVFSHISHWYLSWNTAGGGDCI